MKYERKGRGGMKSGALKKVGGLLMAAVLMLSLVPSAMAAEPESVKEFRNGKTSAVVSGSENFWVLQQDGTLWSSGIVKSIDGTGAEREPPMGNMGGYDYKYTSQVSGATTYFQTYPVKVLENVAQIAVDDDPNWGSCWALKKDGSLWGTGYLLNDFQFAANGNLNNQKAPTFTKMLDGVTHISAGSMFVLAVKNDNTLWGWGMNQFSELATGGVTWETHVADDMSTVQEKPIKIMDDVVTATAGNRCAFAIKADGSLWAWGQNTDGQIGNGGTPENGGIGKPIVAEVPVKIMDDVVKISSVYHLTMALKSDGTLWAWGHFPGYRTNDTSAIQTTPKKIADSVISFTGSPSNIWVVKKDSTLWGMGNCYRDILKISPNEDHDVSLATSFHPLSVTDVSVLGDIASSSTDCVFVKTDGSLWAYGINQGYQWGIGANQESVYQCQLRQLTGEKDSQVIPSTPTPQTATATPTASKILLDGKAVSLDAYNINANNYCKIRDVAKLLNGTGKQFEVTWDKTLQAVSMVSNHTYTTVGGELAKGDGESKTAALNTAKIYLDGKEVTLTAYNIGGNNYIKLRDLGQTFDFGVSFDSAVGAVRIDTTKGYTA